jgi:hypothetical protein
VVVVGGGGSYGRYLVDDLLRHADTSVLVVPPRAAACAWFRTVAGTGRVRDVPGDAPWGGVATVGEILAGRLVRPGLVPLDTWMPAERLWPALTSRGVNLWRRENGGWQLLHADTDVMARAAARPVVDGDWQDATISSSHSMRFGTFPHTRVHKRSSDPPRPGGGMRRRG